MKHLGSILLVICAGNHWSPGPVMRKRFRVRAPTCNVPLSLNMTALFENLPIYLLWCLNLSNRGIVFLHFCVSDICPQLAMSSKFISIYQMYWSFMCVHLHIKMQHTYRDPRHVIKHIHFVILFKSYQPQKCWSIVHLYNIIKSCIQRQWVQVDTIYFINHFLRASTFHKLWS